MSVEEYAKAKRMGMKVFREAAARGESPYVSILDEILKQEGQSGETRIGTYEIPLSLVVGTRTRSRAESFACNFMPILSERSEFALKWQQLYESQLEEGIRDPIRVYEYKNRFYVQEGNKRTSVMKFVESPGILADVTRILPRFESEKQESLYREYADFNRVTGLFHILFTKPGSYGRLAAYFREGLKDPWKTEDLEDLRSAYHRFADCYTAQKPETEAMGDAFLTYLGIFGRETLLLGQLDQIRSNIDKAKDELELSQKDHKVALIEAPGQGKEARREKKSLFEILFARGSEERRINIAFINDKTPETSRWTYAHSLGWTALNDKYGDEAEIQVYHGCDGPEKTEAALRQAVEAGADIVFTTAGQMQPQVLSAALEHPEIKFLNCSVNTSYKSMRTYYARMYEAKYILGMMAAAMSEHNEIGYVADYPVYGALANINAFAIGAQMINPRARISLKWSRLKDQNWQEELFSEEADIISGPEIKAPMDKSELFGLIRRTGRDTYENLALPVVDWGRYYELLVASVLEGSFYSRELTESGQAVNYFYGMSAGVVDVLCSKRIPYATEKLMKLIRSEIIHGDITPFYGEIRTRTGLLKDAGSGPLNYFDVVNMNWLNENIDGRIPPISEFSEDAMDFVRAFGVAGEQKEEPGKEGL